MLKIGIVGLPNVGKSSLFQALTQKPVDTSNYPFATIDPNIGIVPVPDERLSKLAELSHSKKIIPAYIEFVDIAGLVKGASEGEGLGNQFLSQIKEVDAIVEMVRAFRDPHIIHIAGEPDPKRDIEILETELLLKDLETAEKAKGRFEKEAKTGDKKSRYHLGELETLIAFLKQGEKEKAKAYKELAEELDLFVGKPIIYCINYKGGREEFGIDIPQAVWLDVKQELEISAFGEEEKKELAISYHLPDLTRACYTLLGLITFFTTGEDETRAWTIPAGSKAPRAGRAIHSDFEDKFIRASVIAYKTLCEAGSLTKARELGLLRTEGKEYEVKDGDVIEFRI